MLKLRKIHGVEALEMFLHGAIRGGLNLIQHGGVYGLHNLTLNFTSPVVETVTFDCGTGTEQSPLSVQDIKTQIEAQTTGVVAKWFGGQLVLIEATPTSGVALADTGTANAILGFDANAATVGTVYGAVAPAPYLVKIAPLFTASTFLVVTEEV